MRVFIVDDSDLVRERLAALIAEVGSAELVGQADNGRGALEAIQRLRPDVVILDIRMPGGNGLEVLEAIRKGPEVPVVIVLTAFPYPQYRRVCLAAGASYFLDKSTEFDQVAEVLKNMRRDS